MAIKIKGSTIVDDDRNILSANTASISGQIFAGGGTATNPAYAWSNNPNAGIFQPSYDGIGFTNSGYGEYARFDNDGRLLLYPTMGETPVSITGSGNWQRGVQVVGDIGLGIYRYANTATFTPTLEIGKSRSNITGAYNAVLNGDDIGYIYFSGTNGSAYKNASWIYTKVDGTANSSSMPGRLVLGTGGVGTASPIDRLIITANGNIGVSNTSPTERLHVQGNIRLSGGISANNSFGTSGQVLTSTGTGIQWTTVSSSGSSSTYTIDTKTTAYTVVAGDAGKILNCTAILTISLTSAATLGAGFNCWIWNSGSSNEQVTIDPNSTETIDGVSTRILYPGEGIQIISDGTNWQTGSLKELKAYAEHTRPDDTKPNAQGTWSLALGSGASATGSQSISIGRSSTASGDTSMAIGVSASATNNRSTAIGENGSSQGSISAGAGAIALNGSRATGSESFAVAITNNGTSYGSLGTNSIAIGYQAIASGTYSTAIGYKANVQGSGGIAIGAFGWSGSGPTVEGSGGIAIGNQITTGASGFYNISIGTDIINTYSNSINLGMEIKNSTKGKFVWGNGQFATNGDNQSGAFVLRSDTSNNTPEALTTNNSTAAADNQIILDNNTAYAFHGTIVARQEAATGTASAAWKIEGLIRREDTAASTVLVNSILTTISNSPGWGLSMSADTTNGGLKIQVTGASSINIRWVATIQTSEVTY